MSFLFKSLTENEFNIVTQDLYKHVRISCFLIEMRDKQKITISMVKRALAENIIDLMDPNPEGDIEYELTNLNSVIHTAILYKICIMRQAEYWQTPPTLHD
jgi:hypothetical protein